MNTLSTRKPLRRTLAPTLALTAILLALSACSGDAHIGGNAPQLVGLEVAAPTPGELIFSGVAGTRTPAQKITLKNVGGAPLELQNLELTGADAAAFTLTDAPALPLTLEPQASVSTAVTFAPGAAGAQSASLQIWSSDAEDGGVRVSLYGLGSRGEQGTNEPPLQAVVDTLGYAVDVGGDALELGTGEGATGDEVLTPLFEKAGSGPVTLEVVARYGPEEGLPYGYFTLDKSQPLHREVGSVAAHDAQRLLPPATGGAAFDPGAQPFGIYGQASGATQYSLDGLNEGRAAHALRVYPLKDRQGNPVADSYLIGLEEAQNGDYQDAVFILSNVKPAGTAPDVRLSGNWEPLFNGQNLGGWYSYLPSEGRNNDPEGVFRVENGMIHVLGVEDRGRREFGYLATEKSYSDYHLRLEYRWGEKRFAPRDDDKRDSGVVYHMSGSDKVWPQGVEYQIQEGDTGDFWMLGGTTLTTTVETRRALEPRYEQHGEPYTSRGGDFVRIVKDGTHDSRQEWNTVDIIVRGDTATHMINGRINNRAYGLFGAGGDALRSGKILLQAEGAEVFYRNIEIQPLGSR